MSLFGQNQGARRSLEKGKRFPHTGPRRDKGWGVGPGGLCICKTPFPFGLSARARPDLSSIQRLTNGPLRGAHRKGAEDGRDTCCARRTSQRFASPGVSPLPPALLKPETLGRGEGPLARERDLWDHMSSAYICPLFRSAQRSSCCSCHTYPGLRSHLLAPFSPTRMHLRAPCLHTNLEENKDLWWGGDRRGGGSCRQSWIDGLRFPTLPKCTRTRTPAVLSLLHFLWVSQLNFPRQMPGAKRWPARSCRF